MPEKMVEVGKRIAELTEKEISEKIKNNITDLNTYLKAAYDKNLKVTINTNRDYGWSVSDIFAKQGSEGMPYQLEVKVFKVEVI